jgi:hypothetical protein
VTTLAKVSTWADQIWMQRQTAPTLIRLSGEQIILRSTVKWLEKARTAYAAGANKIAKGAARPARAKEICAVLKDTQVSKWVGEVETLSSNSDGLGVLSIQTMAEKSDPTKKTRVSKSGAALSNHLGVRGSVRYPAREPLALDTFKRKCCTFPVFDLAGVPSKIPFREVAR